MGTHTHTRSWFWHTCLAALVSVAGVFVWSEAALAYGCNSAAFIPYNTTVNGDVKVRGKGTASCPGSSQYKELVVTLVRIEQYLPDVRIAQRKDVGQKASYLALPTGCDRSQVKGYKSVEKFSGNPEHTSAKVNLQCQP
jgi:hypothetical protein